MIAVHAPTAAPEIVAEFFELFKISWEIYDADKAYDAVICLGSGQEVATCAPLRIVYSSPSYSLHQRATQIKPRFLVGAGYRIPVYCGATSVDETGDILLTDEESGETVACATLGANSTTVRIGYDIFAEVAAVLTDGQPLSNALIPTVDLHIAFLRKLIVNNGISFPEILPAPEGYRFIACLTHDVDHPSIRRHRLDHTALGFLYRATLGSAFGVIRGTLSLRRLWSNWLAALKLPFMYAGVAADCWATLNDYSMLDRGARSCFFVIPFRGREGVSVERPAPRFRRSGYGATDITSTLADLMAHGHEVGLHGIDAWHDVEMATEESSAICKATGFSPTGVRMHWLYFDKNSPALLDRLGFDYDSTVGYNETVGYRAGTAQVYRPLNTKHLLEVPLHVMDTALFIRQRRSPEKAWSLIQPMIDHAVRSGGVLTINWHDRSIAPERQWREFYIELLDRLESEGAWLAGAADTVSWFRRRRAARFQNGECRLPHDADSCNSDTLPKLAVRVYNDGTGAPTAYLGQDDPAVASQGRAV